MCEARGEGETADGPEWELGKSLESCSNRAALRVVALGCSWGFGGAHSVRCPIPRVLLGRRQAADVCMEQAGPTVPASCCVGKNHSDIAEGTHAYTCR